MPYWITSTLIATPALLWMFLGVGLPWALIALPRRDWADRVMVAVLALAFGPALITAWMFILGSLPGSQMQWPQVFVGSLALALVGWIWVWRKRRVAENHGSAQPELTTEAQRVQRETREFHLPVLIIGLIAVALVIRWLGIAYWPSTAYDALWVYAYQGKLYTLVNHIPSSIGYYPQFLSLQHTYLQLAVGQVDDHVARAVLPWLHLGSILAVYVLGSRLFNRRTGFIAAGLWALYPHMGEWSRYGDLEVPVTFLFTGAAAFFLLAWTGTVERRPYALIAGLLLGIGMWTKPTMGGFIYGVMLVAGIAAVQAARTPSPTGRGDWFQNYWQAFRPRLMVLLITGAACIPLGGVWYIRNILLGHDPITLPDGFWQTLAARSGVEFGWPLLAVLVLTGWVIWRYRNDGLPLGRLLLGLVLILAGLLPSIYNSGRVGVIENRMGLLEWAALAGGSALLGWTLWRFARSRWTEAGREVATRLGWLTALALPYFVTWFYSYSYHYRLSFAIVPLLLLPTAVVVAHWSASPSFRVWQRRAAYVGIIGLSLPGIINPLYDINAGWDWLWTDKLPDDHARYTSGNKALMRVVDGLQIYLDENPDQPLRVVAPEMKRLPFFFPLEDIRIDTMPTRLDELEGVTYFIYSIPEATGDFSTIQPGVNPVLSALALATDDPNNTTAPLRRAWWEDDGVFKYTVYELHLERRFQIPPIIAPTPEGDVTFGGFVRLLGHDIGGSDFWVGRRVIMHLFWQVLEQPMADYVMYIHLRDTEGSLVAQWDGPVSWTNDGNYYSTLVWEPGETIVDQRSLLFENSDAALGEGYRLVIGLYDPITQQRVPMTINGQAAGEGYQLGERIRIITVPAG